MSRPAPTDDALDRLAAADPDLAAVLAGSGRPMVPVRPADFATLLLIVTEQMLSIHAAMAIWRRLEALGPVTPAHFQTHDDDALLAIGFSRAKLRYGRGLAAALIDGSLDLGALAALPDADAMRALTALPGIGRWTAEVFLLFSLGRTDVWPAGDVALQQAVRVVKRLPARPKVAEMDVIAEAWRPWRGAAAHLLWHHYRIAIRPGDWPER
jgi:DNA-3-methyladenine glycosylase II